MRAHDVVEGALCVGPGDHQGRPEFEAAGGGARRLTSATARPEVSGPFSTSWKQLCLKGLMTRR